MTEHSAAFARQGAIEMARTVATLPEGSRITDYISLGVIAKTFPVSKIHEILAATGKTSVRERDHIINHHMRRQIAQVGDLAGAHAARVGSGASTA